MLIDLTDSSKETFQKILLHNIINNKQNELDINYGIVFSDQSLVTLDPTLPQYFPFNPDDDKQLSIIYPQKLNNSVVICGANIESNGMFEKVNNQKELNGSGTFYIGMPAGANLQKIEIQEHSIIVNGQVFQRQEGLMIQFVKKLQKQIQAEQVTIENASELTSRKHAHLKIDQDRIFICDGFEATYSSNGVWVYMRNQRMEQNLRYCIRDFRCQIYLKY